MYRQILDIVFFLLQCLNGKGNRIIFSILFNEKSDCKAFQQPIIDQKYINNFLKNDYFILVYDFSLLAEYFMKGNKLTYSLHIT